MIEYGPLCYWYVKPGFITCKEDAITLSVRSTVHVEQTTDYILELYVLFYRIPFLVGMILTSLVAIP